MKVIKELKTMLVLVYNTIDVRTILQVIIGLLQLLSIIYVLGCLDHYPTNFATGLPIEQFIALPKMYTNNNIITKAHSNFRIITDAQILIEIYARRFNGPYPCPSLNSRLRNTKPQTTTVDNYYNTCKVLQVRTC